jgi:hypothetical protein
MRAFSFALLVLLASGPRRAEPSETLSSDLTAAEGDRVLAMVAVPDAARKVGEVRLVARGRATVVQTLLATRALSRVVAEIRHKEEANWPPGEPGRADMERYLAALYRAEAGLEDTRDAGRADRRLRLAIEFVATSDASGLLLAEFTGDEVDGRLRPSGRRPIETLALSRSYVVRNMRLILADAFRVPERDLARLGPLGAIAEPADVP